MQAKSILLSKTFWFNVAAILAALSETTEFTNVIPVTWMPAFAAVVAVVNVILRTQTEQPVAARLPRRTGPRGQLQ